LFELFDLAQAGSRSRELRREYPLDFARRVIKGGFARSINFGFFGQALKGEKKEDK
jgi:hypothetical protein